MAKGRPGILLYFDTVEPLLEQLNDEELGRLFRASFDYAKSSIEPSFDDRILKMAWGSIKTCLDRDEARYNEAIIQRRYAVYSRESKRHNQEPLSFDAYKEKELSTDNDRHRPITVDNGRHRPITSDNDPYPTTTTTATTKTTKGDRQPYNDFSEVADEDEEEFDGDVETYERPANDRPYVAEAVCEVEAADDLPF
ncbi:MAG: hypothetical protein E7425_07865 [Ruminococcaceae bacterium]|nr:hypothetical protein [Oscillospiraceae bacterium]